MATKKTGSVREFGDAEFGVVNALKKGADSSLKQEASPAKDNKTAATDSGRAARRAR